MKHTSYIRMRAVLSVAVAIVWSEPLVAQSCRVQCGGVSVLAPCNTRSDPCPQPASRQSSPVPGGGGYQAPSYDYEAERRAQEANAEAERQRQVEADRIERERLAEEKRKRDAEFIRNRDATASTLRGTSIGTRASPNDRGLRGSSTVDTGLRELRVGDRGGSDLHGPQAAWKQLHCAAALSGYAMAALDKPMSGDPKKHFQEPNYQEFSFLAAQASNALHGQALSVECPAVPPLPELQARPVDMHQAKEVQKQILSRATGIVERMQKRGNQTDAASGAGPGAAPAANPPAIETADEKLRRVQRELNRINREKITGITKQEIDQQERDRKDLAKLALVNEKVQKGEFVDLRVDDTSLADGDTSKSAPAPRTRRGAAAPR